MKKYIGFIIIGVVSAITTIGITKLIDNDDNTKIESNEIKQSRNIHTVNMSAMPPADMNFMATAKTCVDAVVHIKKQYGQPENFYDLFLAVHQLIRKKYCLLAPV